MTDLIAFSRCTGAIPTIFAAARTQTHFHVVRQALLEMHGRRVGDGLSIFRVQELLEEVAIAGKLLWLVAEQFGNTRRAPRGAVGIDFPQAVLRAVDGSLKTLLGEMQRVLGQLLFVHVLNGPGDRARPTVLVALGHAAMTEP